MAPGPARVRSPAESSQAASFFNRHCGYSGNFCRGDFGGVFVIHKNKKTDCNVCGIPDAVCDPFKDCPYEAYLKIGAYKRAIRKKPARKTGGDYPVSRRGKQ
jgi:hypothetical protein